MSRENKDAFEDDGRTIADMSGVSRRNLFGFVPRDNAPVTKINSVNTSAVESSTLTRKERIWAILGALKAVLLIGLCFAVGLAVVILMFIYISMSDMMLLIYISKRSQDSGDFPWVRTGKVWFFFQAG